MTHVLMSADALGGVWTYAVDLVEALAEHDVTVSLAVMGGALDESQRASVRRVGALRIHESDFALEWMDEPWRAVDAAGRWLLALDGAFVRVVVVVGRTRRPRAAVVRGVREPGPRGLDRRRRRRRADAGHAA
jgi:hypothetical protein